MRRSLALTWNAAAFSVQTAGSAEDALETARRFIPNLIIMDIGLPGMDGLEALRKLRDEMGIPVILLTARRRELDRCWVWNWARMITLPNPLILMSSWRISMAVLRRSQASDAQLEITRQAGCGRFNALIPMHTALNWAIVCWSFRRAKFDLMYALARHAGKVITAKTCWRRLWGAEF